MRGLATWCAALVALVACAVAAADDAPVRQLYGELRTDQGQPTRVVGPDGKATALDLSAVSIALPASGTPVWVRGRWNGDRVALGTLEVAKGKRAERAAAEGATLGVTVDRVSAWINLMPGPGAGGGREYLVVSTTLVNRTKAKLTLALDGAWLSIREGAAGQATTKLSRRGDDGMPTGERSLTLKPGETRRVDWRANGAYPGAWRGKRMYVLLRFATGEERLMVRRAGAVSAAH